MRLPAPASLSPRRWPLLGLLALLAALALTVLDADTAQAQTAPTFSSATVNGDVVTVTFSGSLRRLDDDSNVLLPDFGAWSVTMDGVKYDRPFYSASFNNTGTQITLWLRGPNSGHGRPPEGGSWRAATISYDKTKARVNVGSGAFVGRKLQIDGAEVASFTNKTVTNQAPVPAASSASVNGKTLTVTYDTALDEDSVPRGGAFTVGTFHGGGPGLSRCTAQCRIPVTDVSLSGSTVTLTLAEDIPSHASYASVSYSLYGLAGGPPLLADLGGQQARATLRFRADIRTPNTPPVFYGGRVYGGNSVFLEFNEVLAEGADVPSSAFTVTARLQGGGTRTIRGTAESVRYGNLWARFTVWLAQEVPSGATVTVSYTKPASDPLRDRQGAALESFSGMPLTNGPSRIEALQIASDPGGDDTYGRGDTVQVQATFTTPVRVNTQGGVPVVLIWLDPKYVARDQDRLYRYATYESGSGTHTLTFTYEIASADRAPSGVGLGIGEGFQGPVILKGGRIFSWGGVNANIDHAVVPHNANHKIDGSMSPPRFQSAEVDRTTLTLAFDEILDAGSVPAPGAFNVTVNGTRRNVASGGVAIDGGNVTLTLASAVAQGDTVTVGYTRPSANPLQDAAGEQVESFADETVTNNSSIWFATLTVRAFSGGHGCDDSDSSATCSSHLTVNTISRNGTTYQVKGISTLLTTAGNHLSLTLDQAIPSDWTLHFSDHSLSVADGSLSNGDKTVSWFHPNPALSAFSKVSLWLTESSSGAGGAGGSGGGGGSGGAGGSTGTAQSRVAPEARVDTVAGASTASLWVGWTLIVGDEADGYELRYYAGAADPADDSDWTATGDLGTATAATVADLAADTAYRVQVRALLEDGLTGPWSDSVAGRTKAAGDTTPPEAQSATVDGHAVTVTFDEVLAPVGEGAGLRYLWTVTLDGVDQHPARASTRGLTVTMRIGTAATAGQTATLSYGGGGLIEDAEGNETSAFRMSVGGQVNSVPAFDDGASVTLSIDENHADGAVVGTVAATDADGDSLTYSLTGDDAASFEIGAGGKITVKSGTTLDHETKAGYSFTAQVTDGEDADGETEATPAIDDTIAVTVQVGDVVDTPVTTAVAIVSDPGDDDTYGLDDVISIRVTFSEAVDVSGTPRLKIKMDPTYGEKWASYASGSGTTTLTFTHTVVQPNYSPQGIAVLANSLALNGGDIESSSSDTDADLSHTDLGHDSNHKVNWEQSQAAPSTPTVTAVSITSDPGDDDTYALDDVIRIRVTFSEAVDVSGTPRLKIKMDPTYGEKWASYASGTGTTTLTFTHTVVRPNYSPQGIAVLANSLELNSGDIESAASDTDADLNHTGRGHNSDHKVNWQQPGGGAGS